MIQFFSRAAEKKPPKVQPTKKFAAVTTDTIDTLYKLPREARVLLEAITPYFDQARDLPATPQRWLQMLQLLPATILSSLLELREKKSRQAGYVSVMLCVFARCLLHPKDESGLTCEMTDEDVRLVSNRMVNYYLPFELAQRQGYVTMTWPEDPFSTWEQVTFTYTQAGIDAGDQLADLAPAETTIAGQVIDVPLKNWELI